MDILIVEDSKSEQERLSAIFKTNGYVINSVDTAEVAEKYLNREQISVIILDIGLKDRSGSTLFGLIRQAQPNCKVIIFTGNPSQFLKQRFISEGATQYIVKGSIEASDRAFLRLVNDLIPKQESIAQSNDNSRHLLSAFLREYVNDATAVLFQEANGDFPSCRGCGSREYSVTFKDKLQLPPQLVGSVVCLKCGHEFENNIED